MSPGELHPTLQVVAAMAVVILGGGIAVFSYTRTILDRFLPKAPAKATDTVVVSGSFADGEAIRKLTEAAQAQAVATDALRLCIRENTEEQARTTAAVRSVGDRVEAVHAVIVARRN